MYYTTEDKTVLVFPNTKLESLHVTAFDDNGNLTLVFDERGDLATEKLNISIAPNVDAKPVAAPVAPVAPKFLLTEGKYTGHNPFEVLDNTDAKKAESAYIYFAETLKAGEYSDEAKKEVANALNAYLYGRFCDCDEVAYAEKLTDAQCVVFFKRFGSAITSKIKKPLFETCNVTELEEFLTKASLKEKRALVEAAIASFKKIKV